MSVMLEYLRDVAKPYLPSEDVSGTIEDMQRYDAALKVPGKVEVEVYPFVVALSLATAYVTHVSAMVEGDLGRAIGQLGFARACVHTLCEEYEEPPELEML